MLPEINEVLEHLGVRGALLGNAGLGALYPALRGAYGDETSLLVVSVPLPARTLCGLTVGRQTVYYPVCADDPTLAETTLHALREALAPSGAQAQHARGVDAAYAAVRCGLGKYGKNGYVYIQGHGAFHRPLAFLTDINCSDNALFDECEMAMCASCDLCARLCPAHAIGQTHRSLARAQCLGELNRQNGAKPFPQTLGRGAHHCVVGCETCAMVCPRNEKYIHNTETPAAFSAEETALLLRGTPYSQLPEGARAKVDALRLRPYLSVLPRNLTALLL